MGLFVPLAGHPANPLSTQITLPGHRNVEIPWGQKYCSVRAVVPPHVPGRKRPLGGLLLDPGSLCLECMASGTGSVEFFTLPLTSSASLPPHFQGLAPAFLFFLPQFPMNKVEGMAFQFPLPQLCFFLLCITVK